MKTIPAIILYIGMICGATGCRTDLPRLQEGDLLFQRTQGAMTRAIEAATSRNEGDEYTHVGIAIGRPEADSVLEATSEGGVRIVTLGEFLHAATRVNGEPAVTAMRLSDTCGVAHSVRQARSAVGLPYDYSFRPDNGRFYCSELVYAYYRRADGSHIFTARPMNFRDADGHLPRYWVELFERLGEPVPEGVPGTNPNDLAREQTLYEIGRWFH